MNYLGIEKEKLEKTVNSLNVLLANYNVYYQNLRGCHWNIRGKNFFQLHEVFENLYNDARVKIDDIAERVLSLRAVPWSTMSKYLDKIELKETKNPEAMSDWNMVGKILEDHTVLIQNCRDVIENAGQASDEGTIDMIGGFLGSLEKDSWMLNSWHTRIKKEEMTTA